MRKFFALILFVTAFCILFSATALANINVLYDEDAHILTVSGSYNNASGKSVTLQVINPGKNEDDVISADSSGLKMMLCNIKETRCNADGVFSFQPFKISGDSGYYSIRICLNGQTPEYIEKAFLHISPSFELEFTDAFCDESITDDELAVFLYDKADIIQADAFSAYSEAERKSIVYLCERKAGSVKEAVQKLNCAIAAYEINKAADKSAIEAAIEQYKSYIKPVCKVFATYESLSSDGKAQVAEDMYSQKPFVSAEGMLDCFGDSAIFSAVKTADNYLQLEPVLKAAESWFGTDFSAYYTINDKKGAALKIIGRSFYTISELEAAVKKAVESVTVLPTNNNNIIPYSPSGSGQVINVPQADIVPSQSAVAETSFNDLASVPWAQDAIAYLHKLGIINGKSDGVFCPNDYVTREEFAKMAVVAINAHNPKLQSNFADCPSSHWSSSYVASAYSVGLVNGIDTKLFGVGDFISRQDMTVILYRVAIHMNITFNNDTVVSFNDEEYISSYAQLPIQHMAEGGFVNGMEDGSFAPIEYATRAQAAKVLYEVVRRMEE